MSDGAPVDRFVSALRVFTDWMERKERADAEPVAELLARHDTALPATQRADIAQRLGRPDLAASNRTIASAYTQLTPATGPLVQSADNPNYFADADGNPVFLIGSHTWSNFQDMGMEGDRPFDYEQYMAFMVHHGYNFMRFWNWEHAAWAAWSEEKMIIGPMPYLRTGPGLALDGKPKFDLNQWNQAYFDRMRARIIKASENGIYASIMLFQQFSGA